MIVILFLNAMLLSLTLFISIKHQHFKLCLVSCYVPLINESEKGLRWDVPSVANIGLRRLKINKCGFKIYDLVLFWK